MSPNDQGNIESRVLRIRHLTGDQQGTTEYWEAAALAQSVVHDTVGGAHPIMAALNGALASGDWDRARAVSRSVITLWEEGALRSPRLAIAREIEGELLDIAQAQAEAAEQTVDQSHKQVHLGIATFLAGAALEDSLRRLCDAHGRPYDPQHSSIAKLQAVLYQPSNQVEVISQSENKHITAWGDTRNKADHGRLGDITQTEVVAMVLGVRTLIEKHLS